MRCSATILLLAACSVPTHAQIFIDLSLHQECVVLAESSRLVPNTEDVALGPSVNLDGFDLTCAHLLNNTTGNLGNTAFASFRNANLQFARLVGTFAGADFSGANLQQAVFEGDFVGASFSEANLSEIFGRHDFRSPQPFELVDLSQAILQNVDLEGHSFRGSDLRRADLSNSVFELTDFGGADLRQANLSNVDFNKSNFANLADVRQVDFSNVTAPPSLLGAMYDQFTVFPTEENENWLRWQSFDPERFAMQFIPATPGDTDLNEVVEFTDFLLLTEDFGTACDGTALACWQQGDFNTDGRTDFADFLELSAAFATNEPSIEVENVPEPKYQYAIAAMFVLLTASRCAKSRS